MRSILEGGGGGDGDGGRGQKGSISVCRHLSFEIAH